MRIVFIFIFLGFHLVGFSQNLPSDWSAIDADLLNQHINTEVNKLRKKAKKDPLIMDKDLEDPAQDHSEYLKKEKTISHYQKDKAKTTPKNRIEFYEGSYGSVAENIQFTNKNIPIKLKGEKTATPISDYERLAKSLVLNWKNSKPHYKNMMGEDYTNIFTSISFDPETGNLYAVQLFGNTPYIYPIELKETPPFKPTNSKKCKKIYKDKPLGKKHYGIYIVNDSIFFYSDSRRKFRKSVLRWDDGIAADIVLKDQIKCGQESLMNGGIGQQGFLLEPVYGPQRGKSNIKPSIIPYTSNVYVYLGKVPDWVDQEYEVNLALINKKRPCMAIVYHQYSGDYWNYITINPKLDTLSVPQYEDQLSTMNFKVYFPLNGTAVSSELIKPITDSLLTIEGEIIEAKISSYSSIEGSSLKNIELQNARGKLLLDLLNSSQSNPISKVEMEAFENYPDFYTDILLTKWNYLLELDSIALKNQINNDQNLKDSLGKILDNHRYASCELLIKQKKKLTWSVDLAFVFYKKAVESKNLKDLQMAQNVMCQLLLKDSITWKQFENLDLPIGEKYISLSCNKLLYKYQKDSQNPIALKECILELDTIRALYKMNTYVNTNYAILTMRALESEPYIKLKQRGNPIDSLKSIENIDRKSKAALIINAYIYNIENYFVDRDYSAMTKELNSLYKFSSKSRLTPDELYRIGSMFSSYFMFEEGYYILKKAAKTPTPKAEHLLYLIKVIYALNDEIKKKDITKYLELAASIAGEDFCNYFNSPNLNFQVLNDSVFKSVYCKYCNP